MPIILGNSNGGSGGGGGGVTTLDNGLTLTGTNGALGGPLVANTVISLDDHTLSFDGDNVNLDIQDGAGGSISAGVENNADSSAAQLEMSGGSGSFEFAISDAAGNAASLQMQANSTPFLVTDYILNKGLVGAADYSANYDDDTYVQKGWVLSQIGPKASNKFSGTPAGTTTLTSYTPSASGQYQLNVAVVISGGTGSFNVFADYTDAAGNVQADNLFGTISTGSSYNGVFSVYVSGGTLLAIKVVSVVSGISALIASAITFVN